MQNCRGTLIIFISLALVFSACRETAVRNLASLQFSSSAAVAITPSKPVAPILPTSKNCDAPTPLVSFDDPVQTTTFPSEAINFTVSVTNPAPSGCGLLTYKVDTAVDPTLTASGVSPVLAIAAGQTKTLSLRIASNSQTKNGNYPLSINVRSQINYQSSASASGNFLINLPPVQPPPPPPPNPGPTSMPAPTYTTSMEWDVTGSAFDPGDPTSPLWNYRGYTYFVWVDSTGHPTLDKRKNGALVEQSLIGPPDYVVSVDAHGRFSIGIDKNGFIHVIGNMHNFTQYEPDSRYAGSGILYWKSNQSESVSKGFTFAGQLGSSTSLDGAGWISACAHFFTDNNGELYYTSSVHAAEIALPGKVGVGLYKYNAQAGTWTALGGLPDNLVPGAARHTVLYWENAGFGGGVNWFQNYQPNFRFDKNNVLHFVVSGNTDPSYQNGANRIIYAKSSDGGLTWAKANGNKIPGLPIRGVDGNPNVGDIVATTANIDVAGGQDKYKYFSPRVSVVVDKNGVPGIGSSDEYLLGSSSSNVTVWRTWGGSNWSKNTTQINGMENYGFVTPDGYLVFSSPYWNSVTRTGAFGDQVYFSLFSISGETYNSVTSLDDYGLRTTGVIYNIGYVYNSTNTSLSRQVILKTVISPDPCKGPSGYLCN